MEGTKKIKSMSFHQYSWISEVETTWISLIGWHHKTSSIYLSNTTWLVWHFPMHLYAIESRLSRSRQSLKGTIELNTMSLKTFQNQLLIQMRRNSKDSKTISFINEWKNDNEDGPDPGFKFQLGRSTSPPKNNKFSIWHAMPCHAKDTNPPRKSCYDLQTISFDDFYCLET